MIDRIGLPLPAQGTDSTREKQAAGNVAGGFGELLRQRAEQAEPAGVAFSKHAQKRAEERGIAVTGELVDQLASSVERAQEKGAKNILVFDAGRAFIINVPQGRVVTAMSQDELQENVFTNIDGAVLLK